MNINHSCDTDNKFSMSQAFDQDYNDILEHQSSFSEHMFKIMNSKLAIEYTHDGALVRKTKISNKTIFERVTRLAPITYTRIVACAKIAGEKKNTYTPNLQTLMTLSIVYALDIGMVETLLASLGRQFDLKNRVHYGYLFLIANCRGKSLDYCNGVLQTFGIDKKYFVGQRAVRKQKIS